MMLRPLAQALLGRVSDFLAGDENEAGVATVEFVIAAPLYLIVFLASMESGLLMTRKVMLEHALDLTVRELRLGTMDDPKQETLKKAICSRTVIFKDCENSVLLELRPVNMTTWNLPSIDAECVDRSADINVKDTPVIDNGNNLEELMVVRVCAVFTPTFPTTGLGKSLPKVGDSGQYAIVASSVFVNEPL